MTDSETSISGAGRLHSWKEIAAYLKRDVRTVQRWEQTRGLPVHRASGGRRGTVSALKPELDAWLTSGGARIEQPAPPPGGGLRSALRWAAVIVPIAGALWLVRHLIPDRPVVWEAIPLTSYVGRELEPSLSPDGTQVAFSWEGETKTNYDIYIQAIGQGAPPRRLTSDPRLDFSPVWSPDGGYVASLRETRQGRAELIVIPVDGSPERVLTEVYHPGRFAYHLLSWSRDGKWLAMPDKSTPDEPVAAFVISVETGHIQRLTTPPAGYFGDAGVAFSPDGQQLAFSRYTAAQQSDLYIVELNKAMEATGPPRRVTFHNQTVASPEWLPDGHELLYSVGALSQGSLWRTKASGSGAPTRIATGGEADLYPTVRRTRHAVRLVFVRQSFDSDIWSVPLSPNHRKAVATKLIGSTRPEGSPQYSPDEKWIVFGTQRSGHSEIWLCEADGSNPRRLTSLTSGSPRWSPDGTRIVFDSNEGGHYRIWVMDADGTHQRRLSTGMADSYVPSWSSDGEWIYFASKIGEVFQVWKVAAQGGNAVQLTHQGGFVSLESVDGQTVFYTRSPQSPTPLWSIGVHGGPEKKVLESVHMRAFAVTRDGIYFVPGPATSMASIFSPAAATNSLQFFRFATASSVEVARIQASIDNGLGLGPMRNVALYSPIEIGSDLMLVENFH